MTSEENKNLNEEIICPEDAAECPETPEDAAGAQQEPGCAEEPEEPVDAHAEPEPEEPEEKNEAAAGKPAEEGADARYLRLMADFQNYKKRTEKEKGDIYTYANEQIVAELLAVVDNFERALANECSDPGYAQGMEMIFKQLMTVLEKAGLEEIKALGEEFDPNFHNAVMTEDNPDFESGAVSGVLQKGYTLNSKVIRPTMVKVNN